MIKLTAHPLDAAVFVPNCDKIVPGMMLAACRMNLPSIFVSGGPMLPGEHNGHQVWPPEMFEAVGSYASGKIDAASFGIGKSACHLRFLLWNVHGELDELPD